MATDETVIDIPALEAERDALLVIAGLLRLTHTGRRKTTGQALCRI